MRLPSKIKMGIYIVTAICMLVSQFQFSETKTVEAAPVEKPLLDAPPSVSINGPGTAFIGENVIVSVTFDNTDTVPGYGPIIDLEIPTHGADGAPNPDGLSFISATYLGVVVENTAIPVPTSGCVTHPYMMDGTTNLPIQVCGLTEGNTFVALRLPFGSFTPDQPMLTVDVSLSMSNLADLGTNLTVKARGGYQYGYDPLNNFCCGDDPALTLSAWDSDNITPTLITVTKAYSGPESETATGPNYPRSYTVTAEIAAGQNISAFNLSDVLPANMQYITGSVTTSASSTCSQPSSTTPGGTLSCNFTNPVSGTESMTFGYFIPLRDSGGSSILDPDTGDDAVSCNNASGGGTWTPIDARDIGSAFTQSPAGCEHTLTDKSVATQKSVTVVGGGLPTPGITLEYTIQIQVSDFFAFDQMVVSDTFSDGQRWDTAFTPRLQVNGNTYILASANFNAANYTVALNESLLDGPPPAPEDSSSDGRTTVNFRISDEIITRGQDGRLIGGCVPAAGVEPDGDPDCGTYNDGATTATIVFRSVIQEEFSDTYPSGDWSVDQGDILNNTDTVSARVLDTNDAATPTGYTEDDNSSASVTIPRGTLTKSVYAVNGSTSFSTPIRITAGDLVTYRVGYSLITSDFEDLVVSDYLPLPIFNATEVSTFSNTVCGIPSAGNSCLGPADTYHSLPSAITPTMTTDSGSNWIKWSYGDYDSTSNTASAIDLLFTVTVEDDPFADGLQLTNQAYAGEGSTNGSPGEAASIIQITITEPVMTTTKSVVATDNVDTPAPVFSPALPVTFNAPGTAGPRWSGIINSSITPIDSNISGLDAGDLVTFAIFLENEGSGINGAFDITFRDTFDALGFEYPTSGNPNSINLQIYYGNGTGPIPYTLPGGGAANPGDLFSINGLQLVDPPSGDGVCDAHDPNSGNNVIIITYDLRVKNDGAPGTYTNTGQLLNYTNTEGGPNFLPEPDEDDADVTTDNPETAKVFNLTNVVNSVNSNDQVVIGEVATYTVTLTIPEGTTPVARLVDTLDAGLAFVDLLSVTVSNPDTDGAGTSDEGLYSNVMTFDSSGDCTNCAAGTNPAIGGNGSPITFDFGTLSNTNTNNAIDETINITYRAVALNVAGNQENTLLNNNAAFTWTGGSDSASANDVTVIEPVVNTTKSVLPATADAGDTVAFTVTLTSPAGTGTNRTTAYDVTWADSLPTGLTYTTSPSAISGSCAVHALSVSASGNDFSGSVSQLDPGETCTISFYATVDYSVAPGAIITNRAYTQWTSLPGSVPDVSSYNANSDERTGSNPVVQPNDYLSNGPANLTINAVAPVKSLVTTSETHTGLVSGTERVAIGEIARYRLVVTLPEGTSPNFQIPDVLPPGLTFLDDGTARLALVSNGAPVSSINPAGATLSLAMGNGPFGTPPWVNGNNPVGITPTFILPDLNIGSSNSLTADPDSYSSGTDPYFKLGTLTNTDSDSDSEYVIIEFNALVDNTVGGSNDAGDNRDNYFQVYINGAQNNGNSNSIRVTIAEPVITFNKAIISTPVPLDAGGVVHYRISFANGVGNNVSTAMDVNITDTLAAVLLLPTTGAPDLVITPSVGVGAIINNSTVNGINITIASIPAGASVTVDFYPVIQDAITPDELVNNIGNAEWTSLPGTNGTTGNATGSNTPGASGTNTGERDGSGGHNDYTTTDNDSFTGNGFTITKQITTTSAAHTTGSDLAIGEQVTYAILLTFPEGTTPADTLLDDLPSGLELVGGSPQVITTAAASGGLLTADFSGTVGTQTITPTLGDGGQVQFAFTNVVVAGDNDTTNNTLLLTFDARMTNILANQAGIVISNEATNQVGTNPATTSNSVNVTVVEPLITFGKTIVSLPTPLDAGGVVHYQISYANGTGATVSTALDVHITDALAAVLLLPSATTPDLVITPTAGVGTITNNSTTTNIDITIASVPPGESITIDFYPEIQSDITPSQVVDNVGNSTWTSLSGTPTGERDGSGTPVVNDYRATDNESFTNPGSVTITKQLGSTSAAHTSGSNVTIGEFLTYGILVTFPEGTTSSDQVLDDLPGGLIVVSGTPEIITLAADSGGLLTDDFNGSLGTQNITVDASDGGSVTYDFAQDATNIVVAGDNVTTNNTILLRFQVRVTDVAGNAGFPVATVLSNSATNQVGTDTPTSSNSVIVTVVEPRPILTKSFANVTTPASGASGILGNVIRMRLTYQNTGTSNAFDVAITDALDTTRVSNITPVTTSAGFTYSTSGTNPIAVQYAADAGTAVAPGATVVFELDFILTSANVPGDVIPNTANVTQTTTLDSSTSDGDDSNERNTITIANADLQFNGVELAITKDDGGVSSSPGSNLTYTLDYNNYGNIDATNVILTETVPANTTYDSADNSSAWDCGPANPAPAGSTCTINAGTLAQGANGSITFVLTVDSPFPASVTQISNTSSIDSDQPETIDTDNTDSDTTPVNAAPALTITKDDHVQIVAPGVQLTYDIRVTNNGNQDLLNLEILDTIPAGTSFISASGSGSFDGGTGEVSWPLFDLDAGDYMNFTLTLQVADAGNLSGITSFTNTIHAQDDGTNTTGTPVEAQATDTDQLAILNVKSLTGSNQSGSAMPNILIGEILNYAIRIDIPVGTITSLKAVDILDHGLAFVGCNPSSPISSGTLVLAQNPCTTPSALTVQAEPVTDLNLNSDDAGRHITFDFGQVQNNSTSTQTLIVNYQVIVLDIQDNVDGVTGLNNAVEWQWEGGTLSGSASGVDIVEPELSIVKTVDPVIAALGSVVTYTIDISHTAESTAPAYDALMTDGIPTGLELVPGSIIVAGSAGMPAATITASATQFSIFWTSFPVGETATITFEARFVGPSPVINTANVEWASIQIDPNPPLIPQSPYNVHSTERRYDPLSQAINDYRASSSIPLRQPELPGTGFAPGVKTNIAAQPSAKLYESMEDMWLEIQGLQLKLPIVGVPATSSGWDVTWLDKNAGWLNGTAFPTWNGNSVITGHVYLSNGQPGPFVDIGTLKYGDRLIIEAYGQEYIYEVRSISYHKPDDLSRVLRHEKLPWITLMTCKDYDPRSETYRNRIAVRAVLVSINDK